LAQVATNLPTSLYPEEYARAILKYDYLRRAGDGTQKIMRGIMERDDSAVRDAISAIGETICAASDEQPARTPKEISDEFVERITTMTPSIMTGIGELDKQMGGLFESELTILASRPGMGKTALAMQIAQNVATSAETQDKKVLVFSLEMSRLQLWARMACSRASIPWSLVRSGRAPGEFIDKISSASRELQQQLEGRIFVEDEVWDVPGMISIASRLRPDLVIIDHLGEIRWHEDERDEVKWFGRATKMIRTEIPRRLHCHCVMIHQLSRDVEKRGADDKRPVLSDLRWSGEIEQLADIVLMLYREDYYNEEAYRMGMKIVPMEVWTRKNRQGVMNACSMVNFNLERQTFHPYSAPEHRQIVDKTPRMWYDKD